MIPEKRSGVYAVINNKNGKLYIGSSKNLRRRYLDHSWALRMQRHHNRFLQSAFNLQGIGDFVFYVLEYCENEIKFDREQYYIDKYQSYKDENGYNLTEHVEKTFNAPRCREQSIIKRLKTQNAKPFYVYNKSGKFIGEWLNKSECLRDLNIQDPKNRNVADALNGEIRSLYGYYFIYANELHKLPSKFVNKVKIRTKQFQAFKDDIPTGKVYKNQRECAKDLNIDFKKINLCLKGKRKTHAGYTFKFID